MMRQEFIGQQAKITTHNKTFIGKIIDETKNTIVIDTSEGKKTVLKNNSKIEINNTIIEGRDIIKRPEERIKRK